MDGDSNIQADPDELTSYEDFTYDTVVPPLSEEQIRSINRYQFNGHFHTFTCGNESCKGKIYVGQYIGPGSEEASEEDNRITQSIVLIATPDGMMCGACGTVQDWVWKWMSDGSWEQMQEEQEKWIQEATNGTQNTQGG